MNKEELARMLGVSLGTPSKTTQASSSNWELEVDGEPVNLTETVLKADQWDWDQGNRTLRSTNSAMATPAEMTDFFVSAFSRQPERTEGCTDQLRQKFMEELMESSEYQVLRHSTELNLAASKIAALKFAEEFRKLEMDQPEPPQSKPGASGKPNGAKAQAAQDAADMAVLAAAGQALATAQQEVDQYEEMCRGIGTDPNASNSQTNMEYIVERFQRVRNDYQLRKIFEKSGRFRMSAQSNQRQKVQHGYDDMIGVHLAGDVSKLLPVEMAKLAMEEFEYDILKRLVEKQTLCREYQGIESQNKGPVIICTDESGSMNGEKITDAKAFALAMAWIARQQKRWAVFVSFYAGTPMYIAHQRPGKPNEQELLSWLEHFYSGHSTDMTVPLVMVPKKLEELGCPKGKTDMIIITDGVVKVPSDMANSFNEFKKKEKLRLTTIIIGGHGRSMKEVSDEVFPASSLHVGSEAVNKCFQI